MSAAHAPGPDTLLPGEWATPQDLANLYRSFLGREAEDYVLAAVRPRPMHELVAEMCASDEINREVLHAIVQGRELPHDRLGDDTLAALRAWLRDRLRCDGTAAAPAHLLSSLYAHPVVNELLLLAHGSLFTQALEDLGRMARAGALRLKGKIEFANREHISGWVTDLSGRAATSQLEIRLEGDGRLVGTASAHSYRPDIHKLFGGSGLAGFRCKWDPRQFPPGRALSFTLHEATTGAQVGQPYRFENSFVDQLGVAQMLAHELESIQQRLDTLAGMVPQALSYCAFPLEHYRYYRRAHRVPPPPWLLAWTEDARLQRRRAVSLGPAAVARHIEPPLPEFPTVLVLLDATQPHASATGVRLSADSLREQVGCPNWTLHVVGNAGEIADVAALLAAAEPRVSHLPGWRAAELSVRAEPVEAQAPWVLLLQAGETLDEHALAWLHQTTTDTPEAQVVYWDEDTLRHRSGRAPAREPEHVEPILRTPFDPHSMLELNVVGTSFAARAPALRAAIDLMRAAVHPEIDEGPLAPTLREALVWALHHQAGDKAEALHHVPRFLLTRTDEAIAPGEHAGAERLIATLPPAILCPLLPTAWQHRTWQRQPDPLAPGQRKQIVRWQPANPTAVISVLIPTRDHWQLVQQCVDSLYAMAEHPQALDVIVADNGSTETDTLAYLAREAEAGRMRLLRIDEPFNWSRLNNQMAAQASGEYLLFLNNDTRMLTRAWDSALRGELEHTATGAVGARLVYEDMTVQHAGVVLGYENFVGHSNVEQPTTGDGELPLEPRTTRLASAVTGAFLACRREVFELIGAFNETELGVTFNDVEWCVRATDAGMDVVYAPLNSLVHYESKSRGFDFLSLGKQARAEYEKASLLRLQPARMTKDPHTSPAHSGWSHSLPAIR